jgi:hypothetical protein
MLVKVLRGRINSKGPTYSQTAGSEICENGNVSLDFMKPDPPKKISTNIR